MINGASGQLMAAPEIDTSPPAGPPSNLSAYKWSGNDVGVTWTNGDPDASTQIYVSSEIVEPPDGPFIVTRGPGVTNYDSAIEAGTYNFWYIRHLKNAQYSSWIFVEDPEGTGEA